ncbi:DUF1643 domain-containing protein [Paenibacillus chondroitinus]|uniref:DUF1643 domain-containing protein n=1 Tax=Paenibacillus chondroitinus TaxID=59842 RepID=A0ABU6DHI1_9BACL|nr:DUF1643 domain-containing protein [Paenibacillus chondroitinus]MCY9658491.1 DUF1643 domain-containing protein [Paenibacillus anseongense]MEB4797203.1 DUF1643 domain-containing protein [Paenibacillus chondroitinus]
MSRICFPKEIMSSPKRYYLRISWDKTKPILTALLLNPSKANHIKSDATSNFMVDFAKANGFGTLILVNVISFIEPKSTKLRLYSSAFDEINKKYVRRALKLGSEIIVGWGEKGEFAALQLSDLIEEFQYKMVCFRYNQNRSPTQATYMLRIMRKEKKEPQDLKVIKFEK